MNASGKWAKRSVWLTLTAVLTVGCNPLTVPFLLFHGEPKIPAEYPLRPKDKDEAKHDKKEEITVLVLCHTRPGVTFELAGADRELTSMIAKKLPEVAKESKDEVAVVPAAQVDKFKMANPNWKYMPAVAIGKKLKADYVIEIDLGSVSLYQAGSGSMVYEGRAEVTVDVYDVAAGAGEAKHHYVHPYTYPKTGLIAASDKPPSRFKMEFLEQLAQELVFKHMEHKQGMEIATGRPQ
jgi:hypothetical protein